ncbi:Re/Si-specific NAD(P)(+) transhydrogenase subunit alpha [Candidatus Poribacteria bacterium]|nr:Re/Si-specific NAD(P)(+) transhydrogenase subunit alpha [Candidatus Poribacteria bacterium]
MKIGIPKETSAGERRVAATPDSVKKLLAMGAEVLVEAGAGQGSYITDEQFTAAGARIAATAEAFGADIVLKVAAPSVAELAAYRAGALSVSLMDPHGKGKALVPQFAAAKVNAVALELIPRITRAQSMDVLSSQANIAGYKAVIEAAQHYGGLFPMMMTAAGSVPPAKVVILGAGVAGLQAIATARRLGAQVEAFDVRPEVREQILSLGAKFLDLGIEESGSGQGGYAKELSDDSKRKQQEALSRQLAKADIVITTALIPGRPAPVLVTEEAVKNMRPGSVILDMAAAQGGNCPLTVAEEVVIRHNVILIGHTNLPSLVANHSSRFFARNMVSLLELFIQKRDGAVSIKYDIEDEIVAAALVAQDGVERWPKK